MAANTSKLFWFLGPLNRAVLGPFWWVLLMFIVFYIPFLRPWWWLFAPVLLAIELRVLYIWWMNWDYNYATKKKWVVLEIVPPKEILVPLKAMEDVFTVMWGALMTPPNWRELWCEGELEEDSSWASFEIASIEGNLHFYVRVLAGHRLTVETVLYSHYPELEIQEVPDYTKEVPQNIPNEEWDVYGEDFILGNESPYPIRTYEKFFEPQGEKIQEEGKRIDPMASLLELMSKLGPNEQFWLQFTITSLEPNYLKKKGQKIIDKLLGKAEKKTKTLFEEIAEIFHRLIIGPESEGSGESKTWFWLESSKDDGGDPDKVMTPGEKDILMEVEEKIKKPLFRTNIRGVYVAKRDAFKASHKVLTRSYFAHFNEPNLNFIKFSAVTRPKTQYVFRKRIPFIRARRQFRNYVMRFPPLFPDRSSEMAILNPEEMATLYHFPIKITGLVSPTMSRVESKKGGPPPNLPTE